MKHGLLIVGVTLAAMSGASSASGQVGPDPLVAAQDMTQGRQARRMEFGVTAKVEHDTNVARASDTLAAQRGLRPEDTIFTPSITADILLPVGQQAVFINGEVGYQFHDVNKRLDYNRIDVAGGVGNKLGPCGTVLSGGYFRGRNQLDDVVLDALVDNILKVERVSAQLTCVREPGLGLMVTASRDWGENTLPQTKLADFETTSMTGGITYQRPAFGSLSILGNFARTEYPNQVTLTGQRGGYELIGALVRFERRLGGRIQATLEGGYSQVELLAPLPAAPGATNGSLSEFEGFTYSGRVGYRASSRLRLEAVFARQVQPTLLSGRAYDIQTNFSLRTDYQIGSRILMAVEGVRKDTKSRGGVALGPNAITEAETDALLVSIRYRQSQRITFVLSGALEDRKADNRQFDYSSERIGLSAELSL